MAQKLKLHSPVCADPLVFKWPVPTSEGKEGPEELVDTIRLVCEDFPELVSPLEAAGVLKDGDEVENYSFEQTKTLCERYNKAVDTLKQQIKGSLRLKHVKKRASRAQLKHILHQCYNHSVKDPEKLNHYEPFSPEVYGETSFELVEQMINYVKFSEDDYFIDLGSGVGQVVLQVSAATDCKFCYGVEKAEWPADYAVGMEREFKKWMKWYGKEHGEFLIEKGDFLHDATKEKLGKATIVFVNNFAFGPQVDHELKARFANCVKEGARIVSSKAFCPLNFRITERNLSDIGTIMSVQELSPLCGAVSWTGKPFAYYVHTIDRTLLEKYFQRLKNPNKKEQPEQRKDRRGRPVMSIKDKINGGLSGVSPDSQQASNGRCRPPFSSAAKVLDFDSASNSSLSTSTTEESGGQAALVYGPTTRRQWNQYVNAPQPASQSATENESSNAEAFSDSKTKGIAEKIKKKKKRKTIKRLNNGALGKKKSQVGRKKKNSDTSGSSVLTQADVKLRARQNSKLREERLKRRATSPDPNLVPATVSSSAVSAPSVSTTTQAVPKAVSQAAQPSIDSLNLLHAHTVMSTSGKESDDKVNYNDRRMTEPQNAFFKPSVQKQTVTMLEKHAGFLKMIENMKQQYLSYLTFMQTPEYRAVLLLQIEQEKKKSVELQEKKNKLEKEISGLQKDGVDLIKERLKELGLKAESPRELISQAQDVILRNKELKARAASLGAQVSGLNAEHNHKINACKKILDKKNTVKPLKNGANDPHKLMAGIDRLSNELQRLQEINKTNNNKNPAIVCDKINTEVEVKASDQFLKQEGGDTQAIQQNYTTFSEALGTLKSAIQSGSLHTSVIPTTFPNKVVAHRSVVTSANTSTPKSATTLTSSSNSSNIVTSAPKLETACSTSLTSGHAVTSPNVFLDSIALSLTSGNVSKSKKTFSSSNKTLLMASSLPKPVSKTNSIQRPSTVSATPTVTTTSSWTTDMSTEDTTTVSSPRILPLGTKIDIRRPNKANGLRSIIPSSSKPQVNSFTSLQRNPRSAKTSTANTEYTENEKCAAQELIVLGGTPSPSSTSQSAVVTMSSTLHSMLASPKNTRPSILGRPTKGGRGRPSKVKNPPFVYPSTIPSSSSNIVAPSSSIVSQLVASNGLVKHKNAPEQSDQPRAKHLKKAQAPNTKPIENTDLSQIKPSTNTHGLVSPNLVLGSDVFNSQPNGQQRTKVISPHVSFPVSSQPSFLKLLVPQGQEQVKLIQPARGDNNGDVRWLFLMPHQSQAVSATTGVAGVQPLTSASFVPPPQTFNGTSSAVVNGLEHKSLSSL